MSCQVTILSRSFALAAAIVSTTAFAQNATVDGDTAFTEPCAAEPFRQFDFWVGDWVAFDYETGVVQGIDRIEIIEHGCALRQHWSQLTDRYRTPDAPHRYGGMSISAMAPGPRWQQMWVGNSGGAITLQGELRESDGAMVMVQEFAGPDDVEYHRTWYWVPEEDGTVHSWGEIRIRQENGEWGEPQIPWNLRYVSRSAVGNLVEAPEEE
ncbi:MAG: hypothetical protein AAGE05_02900 [Pseudomonadota bacterium]